MEAKTKSSPKISKRVASIDCSEMKENFWPIKQWPEILFHFRSLYLQNETLSLYILFLTVDRTQKNETANQKKYEKELQFILIQIS